MPDDFTCQWGSSAAEWVNQTRDPRIVQSLELRKTVYDTASVWGHKVENTESY